MLSRDLARDVVKSLKLAIAPSLDPGIERAIAVAKALLVDVGMIKDPMSQTPEERGAQELLRTLVAVPVDKSRVIALEFRIRDRNCREATNAIAEAYLAFQRSANRTSRAAPANGLPRDRDAAPEVRKPNQRSSTTDPNRTCWWHHNTTLSNQQLGDSNASGWHRGGPQRIEAESKARLFVKRSATATRLKFSESVNSDLMRRLSNSGSRSDATCRTIIDPCSTSIRASRNCARKSRI